MAFVERFASGEKVLIRERLLYVYVWLHYIFSVINCLIFIALCIIIIIIYWLFLVHCVFFVVIWIWIFGVLTPLSAIFQLYHGDQFTKPGANPCHIGDRLVWAVRSNDLTHWTTRDLFFFVVCFCLITLCIIIIYCLFLITGTLCIFCCNLNLNFWCFMPLSAIFQLYIMVTNLQSRVRTHAVLVIGLYELLDPTT